MATRLYGLFRRSPDGKHWERLYPSVAVTLGVARRVFQDALLFPAAHAERRLRPVK